MSTWSDELFLENPYHLEQHESLWPHITATTLSAEDSLIHRQHILSGENPTQLCAVIEEHALQRLAGDPDVMQE